MPISAPVTDPEFWAKLEKREYLIGAGDALDVVVTFIDVFDEAIGIYTTDQNSYVVEKVIKHVPRKPDATLDAFLD